MKDHFFGIKLIASDLDGTLLNSKSELNSDFFHIINRLRQKDIRFVAASGRQYYSILKKFEPIEKDLIIIAENGSYVRYCEEELLIQVLKKDDIKYFINKIRSLHNAYAVLCGKKSAYVENHHSDFLSNVVEYYAKLEIVDDLMTVQDDFLKIAICDLDGAAKNSYTYFQDMKDYFQIKVSGEIWLDISHINANKGNALTIIQERYNISKEQTMAFGDYYNDIELLQQAYYSFAVANAQDDVKKVARYLIGTNNDDSVIKVLRGLI